MIKKILKFYRKSDYMRFYITQNGKTKSLCGKWKIDDDNLIIYQNDAKIVVPIKNVVHAEINKKTKSVIGPVCYSYYTYHTKSPKKCKVCGADLVHTILDIKL